jgi:hypothetical protein
MNKKTILAKGEEKLNISKDLGKGIWLIEKMILYKNKYYSIMGKGSRKDGKLNIIYAENETPEPMDKKHLEYHKLV